LWTQNSTAGDTSSEPDMRSEVGYGSSVLYIQCIRCWDEYQVDAATEWYDCESNHRHFLLTLAQPDEILLAVWAERHQGSLTIRHRVDAAPLSLWQSLC
jgi:REP element-mobilizing transposase RayT